MKAKSLDRKQCAFMVHCLFTMSSKRVAAVYVHTADTCFACTLWAIQDTLMVGGQNKCSDACTDIVYDVRTDVWYDVMLEACLCEQLMLHLDALWCLQAENPKQQYLLLHALNEVITSLNANTTLPDRQQDEVNCNQTVCHAQHMFSLLSSQTAHALNCLPPFVRFLACPTVSAAGTLPLWPLFTMIASAYHKSCMQQSGACCSCYWSIELPSTQTCAYGSF